MAGEFKLEVGKTYATEDWKQVVTITNFDPTDFVEFPFSGDNHVNYREDGNSEYFRDDNDGGYPPLVNLAERVRDVDDRPSDYEEVTRYDTPRGTHIVTRDKLNDDDVFYLSNDRTGGSLEMGMIELIKFLGFRLQELSV